VQAAARRAIFHLDAPHWIILALEIGECDNFADTRVMARVCTGAVRQLSSEVVVRSQQHFMRLKVYQKIRCYRSTRSDFTTACDLSS
jgi:hypothetical protein